jgi:hypothetical protein
MVIFVGAYADGEAIGAAGNFAVVMLDSNFEVSRVVGGA